MCDCTCMYLCVCNWCACTQMCMHLFACTSVFCNNVVFVSQALIWKGILCIYGMIGQVPQFHTLVSTTASCMLASVASPGAESKFAKLDKFIAGVQGNRLKIETMGKKKPNRAVIFSILQSGQMNSFVKLMKLSREISQLTRRKCQRVVHGDKEGWETATVVDRPSACTPLKSMKEARFHQLWLWHYFFNLYPCTFFPFSSWKCIVSKFTWWAVLSTLCSWIIKAEQRKSFHCAIINNPSAQDLAHSIHWKEIPIVLLAGASGLRSVIS